MLSSLRDYFYRAEQSTDTELHHMVQQYNPKLNISKTIKFVRNRQTRTKKLLSPCTCSDSWPINLNLLEHEVVTMALHSASNMGDAAKHYKFKIHPHVQPVWTGDLYDQEFQGVPKITVTSSWVRISPSIPELWCCIMAGIIRTLLCHSEIDLWTFINKISSLHYHL